MKARVTDTHRGLSSAVALAKCWRQSVPCEAEARPQDPHPGSPGGGRIPSPRTSTCFVPRHVGGSWMALSTLTQDVGTPGSSLAACATVPAPSGSPFQKKFWLPVSPNKLGQRSTISRISKQAWVFWGKEFLPQVWYALIKVVVHNIQCSHRSPRPKQENKQGYEQEMQPKSNEHIYKVLPHE